MKSRKIYGVLLGLTVMVTSCEIIEDPYQNTNSPPGGGGNNQVVKNILVEDFTGHTCGNCWEAAKVAEDLHDLYGDQIITIATHVGFFAKPKNNPDGSYSYDFRTPAGTEIDQVYQASALGLPQGMVNRKEINGSRVLGRSEWATVVSSILEEDPDLSLEINATFNSDSSEANVTVTTNYINTGSTDLNLVVNVLENNIVNWQKMYTDTANYDEPNYVHQHVLRKCVSATFGDALSDVEKLPGESVEKSYTVAMGSDWDPKNCEIVAYVIEGSTEEVIQAEKAHIK